MDATRDPEDGLHAGLHTTLLVPWRAGELREVEAAAWQKGSQQTKAIIFATTDRHDLRAETGIPLFCFCAPCLVLEAAPGEFAIAPPRHLPTHIELALLDFSDKHGGGTDCYHTNVFQNYINPLSLMSKELRMVAFVETHAGWRAVQCARSLYFSRYSQELLDSRAFPGGEHLVRELFEPNIPRAMHATLRLWLDEKLRAILGAENDARTVRGWLAAWRPDMGELAKEDGCALLVRDAGRRTRRLLELAGRVVPASPHVIVSEQDE